MATSKWITAVATAVIRCLMPGAEAGESATAKIPIVGWGAFQRPTAELYREAKDAGFSHLTQWCATVDAARFALSEAEKAGIKLILGFGGSPKKGIERMMDGAEALTSVAKGSPALGLYFVCDEPHVSMAGAIGECVKRYEALDPAHPCYVNLLGSCYDPDTRNDSERMLLNSGCATYSEYLNRLYRIAPIKMVSVDVYPVLSAKPIERDCLRLHGARVFLNERWYETLEIASAFARERGVPLFAFALATAHQHYPANTYPVPTKAHLRLQMYSNLAYGAQMFQYFRYTATRPAASISLMAYGGKRSPIFNLIREVNQEMQARAYVFLGAKVQDVWHTGVKIPIGTKRLEQESLPPFVKSFSAGPSDTAVVSWLKNGEKNYLVVVNRDPNDDISFTATFVPGVDVVRRDGTHAKAEAYVDQFWLESGDAMIFAAP